MVYLHPTDEYCIYLRKSRKDMDMESQGIDTLARHHKILTEYAYLHGLRIGEIYREIVSGDSIEARPEMQRLLTDVRNNRWRGVLVTEVERLARGDTKDQGTVAEAFKFSETLIITPDRIYDPNNEDDEEYFEFGLFLSRREYQKIKRRMQAGIKQSTLEGNYLCPVPPYGYDIVNHGRRNRTLAPNPQQAPVVDSIFKWYTQDLLSICQIVRRLTDSGIPTSKNLDHWSGYSVRHILENPVYIGKVTHGKYKQKKEFIDGEYKIVNRKSESGEYILADGKHPALISEDVFLAAQSRRNKTPKVKQDNKLKNPLAGLLYCSECGKAMHHKITTSDKKRYSRYIHRIGSACPNYHGTASAREVLAAVSFALNQNIHDFEIRLEASPDQPNAEIVHAMEKNLQELARKKQKIYAAYENDVYSDSEFIQRRAEIQSAIDALERSISDERQKQLSVDDFKNTVLRLSQASEALIDDAIPAKQKNDLLKQVVKSIDFSRKTCAEPFEITVNLL